MEKGKTVRHRKRFATTFRPEFIRMMKFEALKRDMPVSRLIELAINDFIKKEDE